jgi:hypothetical protein
MSTVLPSGREIRHVTGPLLVATKLEAFENRGQGNFTHHDLEDIINLVDGRPEIVEEMNGAEAELREFVRGELDDLLATAERLGVAEIDARRPAVDASSRFSDRV